MLSQSDSTRDSTVARSSPASQGTVSLREQVEQESSGGAASTTMLNPDAKGRPISAESVRPESIAVTAAPANPTNSHSNLLLAVGSAEASVLALTFSLALFIVQRAAESASPRLLQRFLAEAHTLRDYSILAALTCANFAIAAVPVDSLWSALWQTLSIIGLVWTWRIVWVGYKRVLRILDATSLIEDWETSAVRAIRNRTGRPRP